MNSQYASVAPTGAPAPVRASVGESLVRGTLANLSPQPLTWGATLLATTLIPRFLGSDAYGQLTFAFAITTLAAAGLDLGIVEYLTRRVAQRQESMRRDIGVALVVQVVTFAIGALAMAAIAPFVAPGRLDVRIFYIALVSIVGGCTQSVLTAALRGREDHALYAWLTATPVIVSTLGTVLALVAGADVLTYALLGVALSLGSAAFNWWISGLRPLRPSFDIALVREAREFVKSGFPFLSWNLTMNVYSGVDRLLLGLFVPVSEIGWYAAAYRIIGIPVFIPTLITAPLYPVLSRAANQPDALRRAIAHTLRITLLCTAPLAAGICVVAPIVPSLLGWPTDFAGAIPLMLILSLQMPIVALDMVLGTVLMAIGRERQWVKVGLAAVALNIGVNLVSIPLFEQRFANGAIGASVVTVLTEILMFIGALILLPKHLLDRRSLGPAAKVLIAAAAAALVAAFVLQFALVLAAIAGASTYVTMVLGLRALTTDDVRYILDRLLRRRLPAA